MTEKIENGVRLSNLAGDALGKISDDIVETTNFIEEISAAMQEQAAGAAQIVQAVSSVVDATHSIRSLTVDQGEQSNALRSLMNQLVELSGALRQAAEDQSANNQTMIGEVDAVFKEAQKNLSVSISLRESLSRFKIKDEPAGS